MLSFGDQLALLRKARGMTAKRLAELIKLDPSYIAQVERGRRDPPRKDIIERMTTALGLECVEAEKLVCSAANERLMKAIAASDVRTPAMDLLEIMLKHDEEFGSTGFLAVKIFARAYLLSKSEWTGIDQTFLIFSRATPQTTEATM